MKHIAPAVFALLVLIIAVPASAQSRSFDITGNFVWLDATGGGTFEDLGAPADLDIEADAGYGVAANIFFGERLSTEFAIARVDAETNVTRRRAVAATGPGGTLEYMPVTAVLQWHFAPNGFIDPYIGGGAAYLIYDFSESQGVHGIDEIDFDDDLGLAINAGIGIRISDRFGITLDGKYVPVESNARAVIITPGEESEGRIDVSPIILSAGLTLRF